MFQNHHKISLVGEKHLPLERKRRRHKHIRHVGQQHRVLLGQLWRRVCTSAISAKTLLLNLLQVAPVHLHVGPVQKPVLDQVACGEEEAGALAGHHVGQQADREVLEDLHALAGHVAVTARQSYSTLQGRDYCSWRQIVFYPFKQLEKWQK